MLMMSSVKDDDDDDNDENDGGCMGSGKCFNAVVVETYIIDHLGKLFNWCF